MSGSLPRALGLWMASQVAGLNVFSDELANTKHRYPACTVTELSSSQSRLGCSKRDFVCKDDDTGHVVKTGKMMVHQHSFRLVVSSPSSKEKNGQEIADVVAKNLEDAVVAAGLSFDPIVLEDSDVEPTASFKLDRMVVEDRQQVATDISGEPFLYRCALRLRVVRTVPVETSVDGVMERIHVER